MNEDVFAHLTQTPEELQKGLEEGMRAVAAQHRHLRDPRICSCGHSARSHASQKADTDWVQGDDDECRPSKVFCACTLFVAVLESDNVRKFQFLTRGPGAEHAFSKGIAAAQLSGIEVRWAEGYTPLCWLCKDTSKRTEAVPLDSRDRVTFNPGSKNPMLCEDCKSRLMTRA
jgi:hypothetical protein